MCIIAGKISGLPLMEKEIFENMWSNNSDGAGYMYANNGTVYIRKGFMTFDSFWASITDLGKNLDLKTVSMVFHFRITTHGGTSKPNCHPFAVGDGMDGVTALKTKCKLGMAHNGIINAVKPTGTISDTMQFVLDIVNPVYALNKHCIESKEVRRMFGTVAQSKLMFLDGNGRIYSIGQFEVEDGIFYSNNGFSYNWNSYYSQYYGNGSTLQRWGGVSDIAFTDRTYYKEGNVLYLYGDDPRDDESITVSKWNAFRQDSTGKVFAYIPKTGWREFMDGILYE